MPKVLKAVIRYRDNEYGAFEVRSVLGHIHRTFPGVIICLDHEAWRAYNWYEENHPPEKAFGALKVAMRDGIRRGPRYRFRFQAESGEIIFGYAGRDVVVFLAEEGFPPDLEQAIRMFLESLKLGQPEIEDD